MQYTKFQQAIYEAVLVPLLEEIPEHVEPHEYPPEFEKKIRKLFSRSSKPYYALISTAGRRAACIIVIILLGLSVLTVSLKAFLPEVWNVITEWFDDYVTVLFKDDENAPEPPNTIEEIMEPKYVPEGFEAYDTMNAPTICFIAYSVNGSREALTFSQYVYNSTDYYNINFDDSFQTDSIIIAGYSGLIGFSEKKNIITWTDGQYIYSIDDFSKTVPSEELALMASSIYDN